VFDQWYRLVWWLGQGQNAAAVQALASVAMLLLTVALALITWRYVRLTKTAVDVARAQFQAELEPKLAFSWNRSDGKTEQVVVRNVGSTSVRIVHVVHYVYDRAEEKVLSPGLTLCEYEYATISPSDSLTIPVSKGYLENEVVSKIPESERDGLYLDQWLMVQCCNPLSSNQHTFTCRRATGDVMYSPGRSASALKEPLKPPHQRLME
jgi:hypothetical protein